MQPRGRRPRFGQQALGQLQGVVDGTGQQRVEDVVLGGEMVVQRRLPDADRILDAVDRALSY